MLSTGPAATADSRGDRDGGRQPGPAGRLVLASVVVGLLGVLVLGVAAGPAAGQNESDINAPAVAYTETAGGDVQLVDADGDTVDTGVDADIIGPVADMDKDGTLDVTAVNENGNVILIPAVSDASSTTLTTDSLKNNPGSRPIAIGDVDDDGTLAVLYSNQNDGNFLYRVEPGGSPRVIYDGEETKGVLGHGDFTGDGADETVFRGSSERIKWVDESGTVGDTGTANYGSNNGVGLGRLVDYDGDGTRRVSAIDGSNVPALIDSNGEFYRPDDDYQEASKAPVAAADLTGDGNFEIVHRNTDTGTIHYMTTDGTSVEYVPGNSAIEVSDTQGLSGTGDAVRLDATAADYASGPNVSIRRPVDGETYSSHDVPLDVSADEASDWSFSVDGGDRHTVADANGTRTLNTVMSGLADGHHNVTVYAEDSSGSGVGTASASFTVDTTAPSVSNFAVTDPDGQDVSVSFDSDETVTDIGVDLAGPEDTTLTESHFTESGGTYTATYEGDSDGDYTATLETARDAGGNEGATGQSDGTTVDTTAPAVTVEEPTDGGSYDAGDVSLDITADETSDWTYSLDGGTNESLTSNAGLSDLADGRHSLTVYAEDAAGNVRAETVTFTVDTTAPTIPADSFAVDNPEDRNVSVRIHSDERLENIGVNITGAESATLTKSDFTEDGGTYTATYEGDSDGEYTATLETAADAVGNEGATGQSNSTAVGTFSFGSEPSDGGLADGGELDSDGEETVVSAESVSPGDSEADRMPEAYVNVSNPEPGQTLLVNETGAIVVVSGVLVDSNAPENGTALADSDADPAANIPPKLLLVETNTSDDFELSVRTYEVDLTPSRTLMTVEPESAQADRPENAEAIRPAAGSFESETGTVAAGYVSINTTLASEEVDGATFQFSVRQEYLEMLGVAPEEVTLHRQVDDGRWEANETTYLGSVGEYHRYETEMSEVTTLALGTGVSTTEVTNASLEKTAIEAGETAAVTAAVVNRGRTATERTVRLTHDGNTVDMATVELEGNEITTVTLAHTPDSTGEYDLSVESTDLETLVVERETGPDETEGSGTDGDGPGFGVGVALAALCGVGYALRRRDGSV